MFYDRIDAGNLLVPELRKYQKENSLIMAVPRGGVPIAYVVAKTLNLPLELVLTKKIGHPANKEYAIGAVSLSGMHLIPHLNIAPSYIENEVERIRTELRKKSKKFMGNKKPEDLQGKTLIIIDDGIATGNTLLMSIKTLKESKPAKIVIAVPVATREAVNMLSKVADEVLVLQAPKIFWGVGAFYENFDQVSDEEVMDYLEKHRKEMEQGEEKANG